MTLLGSQLNENAKREAFARFVHRMTTENIARHPAHARRMIAGGYRMPIISDAEWLASTAFRVTAAGNLDGRVRYCRTGVAS